MFEARKGIFKFHMMPVVVVHTVSKRSRASSREELLGYAQEISTSSVQLYLGAFICEIKWGLMGSLSFLVAFSL